MVTDGFTGNVFLKTAEGLGKLVKNNLKDSFTKNGMQGKKMVIKNA